MDKLKILVSCTMKDLQRERDAVEKSTCGFEVGILRPETAGTPIACQPSDKQGEDMTYHVYENWTAEDKAKIHFSDCSFCNNGEGTDKPKVPGEHGEWHGAFDTFQEALRFARGTGRNVSTCGHCGPH